MLLQALTQSLFLVLGLLRLHLGLLSLLLSLLGLLLSLLGLLLSGEPIRFGLLLCRQSCLTCLLSLLLRRFRLLTGRLGGSAIFLGAGALFGFVLLLGFCGGSASSRFFCLLTLALLCFCD